MKKLVLFVAIVATVALSACKKEAAPVPAEDVTPIEATTPEEAAPLEETPEVPVEAPAETPAQ
jgi:hypothetical protein